MTRRLTYRWAVSIMSAITDVYEEYGPLFSGALAGVALLVIVAVLSEHVVMMGAALVAVAAMWFWVWR